VTEADHGAYLDSIRAPVAEHGHAVQQAAPDDEESLGWSYIAERLREGGKLPLCERDPTVLEGFDVTYLEVSDTTTEDFAVALRLQSDFRALQVVWPDMENRFPWESGYSFPPAEQRLLGVPEPG
jgi:hypothetical protein